MAIVTGAGGWIGRSISQHLAQRGARIAVADVSEEAEVQALDGYNFLTAYGVSKAALVALTRYVATRHGRDGIRCNAGAPGLIPHAGLRKSFSQELIDGVLRHNLVSYHGDTEDIAQAVACLASDESKFVTGQLLVVDGSYTAHSPSFAEQSPEGSGTR